MFEYGLNFNAEKAVCGAVCLRSLFRFIFINLLNVMKNILALFISSAIIASCPLWKASAGEPIDESLTTVRILEGDNSDPSIVRHGSEYYLVHSSFVYTPGLVVYKSANLVDWTPCSVALNEFTGDVWAPDITVVDGRFYIYFPTLGNHGKTSMVTWADDPSGPWSKPVDLHVGGIDPEHVVDADGRRYLLMSSGDMYPLSADGCSIVGEPVNVYRGWEIPDEYDIESISMEGLNIKKVGEYYYLFAAEGGTAGPPTSHMVVEARSKSVLGPWENAPFNPLLRTQSRDETWWSKGHGSVVDTEDGRLFMIFHAYENGYQTLGRQTLLRELELKDGWLRLKEGAISLPAPARQKVATASDFVWQTCREHNISERFYIGQDTLRLVPKGVSPAEGSPLLARTSAHRYEVEACVRLKGGKSSAGLVDYYDERYHFGFGFDRDGLLRYRRGQVSRAASKCPEANREGCMWLRMRNDANVLTAWYSADGRTWHKFPWGFDVSGVHHNTVYGFLFLRPGIYAGGEGEVEVTDFKLTNLDL